MTRKNPMLSLWLSGANAWAGAARGLWTAELRRRQAGQQAAAMREATRQAARFWSGAWMRPAAPGRSRKRG